MIRSRGGLFAWMQLPDGLSAEKLLPLACKEGVAFIPGNAFFPPSQDGAPFLRLNFVMQPPDQIEERMKRLAKAIRRLESSSKKPVARD